MDLSTKTPQSVMYIIRHFLTLNIADPLPAAERGYSTYTQYFRGTNAAGQTNYLERRPTTNGTFFAYINTGTATAPIWTQKTITTDFTLDRTNMLITWTGYTPTNTSDIIKVTYQAINPWIYDDNPNLSSTNFPRMSVLELNNENEDPGQGFVSNYSSGIGQRIVKPIKVIVRNRRGEGPSEGYLYGGEHLKNYDLTMAISQAVEDFFNSNRYPVLWKLWDNQPVRSERITSEEDTNAILRRDLNVKIIYYRGATS